MAEDKRATIRDVAALAGVSPGTVSKALNGTGQISAATRHRVQAAADQLSFQPNDLARSVFERRSFTVGMITTDSFERFSVPVMLGAEDALGAGRISVFLCDSRDDPIREQHYIDQLQRRRVDGFIVTGRSSNHRPPLQVHAGTPVVYALTPSRRSEDCSVVVDDVAAGELAAEHLLRLGRDRIAHITGPEHFDAARRRAAGLRRRLEQEGIELVGAPWYGAWNEGWGRQAVELVLRDQPDVNAIFCGSDLIARGAADGLREAGRSIPGDVSLVGLDNWEVIATGARPALTSVDMNLREVGLVAAQFLLEGIEGRVRTGTHRVCPRLVIRGSTRAVADAPGVTPRGSGHSPASTPDL